MWKGWRYQKNSHLISLPDKKKPLFVKTRLEKLRKQLNESTDVDKNGSKKYEKMETIYNINLLAFVQKE